MIQRIERNKKKLDGKHNIVAPVSTKEINGKQFRFDDKKATAYVHPTKLKNFLVHAGGGKPGGKNDPFVITYNKRENQLKTSSKLTELLSGHGKNMNLPVLKPASQPNKDLIKTSYLPFFSNNFVEPVSRHEEMQWNAENKGGFHNNNQNVLNSQGKGSKRPKSGENTAAALKKIYVGTKEKIRKLVWNSPPVNS